MARCTAHNRRGEPCQRDAIRGGNVCRTHGGAIGHVKAAAAARLRALVDPSIGVLDKTLKNGKRPDLALKAATDVLDRQGFGAVHKHEDVTPVERMSSQERLERLRQLHQELLKSGDELVQ